MCFGTTSSKAISRCNWPASLAYTSVLIQDSFITSFEAFLNGKKFLPVCGKNSDFSSHLWCLCFIYFFELFISKRAICLIKWAWLRFKSDTMTDKIGKGFYLFSSLYSCICSDGPLSPYPTLEVIIPANVTFEIGTYQDLQVFRSPVIIVTKRIR